MSLDDVTARQLPGFDSLVSLLDGRRIVVLAGAGCSTESGIPDYRGPDGRLRVRKPIQFGDFVRSPETRARYWARSTVGWSTVSEARPNAAHAALARLEGDGVVGGIITQNVDGLHQAAGSRRVVELHGALERVRCLDCGARSVRDELQDRLVDRNREWIQRVGGANGHGDRRAAPDGDADLTADLVRDFLVPPCDACGGVLKPDVVFFGESVPRRTVAHAWELFEECDALLVVGSSLMVYSGRRFVYRAATDEVPIGIVTLGPTRGDDLAQAKVEARLGAALPRLAGALLRG